MSDWMLPLKAAELIQPNSLKDILLSNQERERLQQRNALKDIFADPAAFDVDKGMVSPNAIRQLLQTDPAAAIELQQGQMKALTDRDMAKSTLAVHNAQAAKYNQETKDAINNDNLLKWYNNVQMPMKKYIDEIKGKIPNITDEQLDNLLKIHYQEIYKSAKSSGDYNFTKDQWEKLDSEPFNIQKMLSGMSYAETKIPELVAARKLQRQEDRDAEIERHHKESESETERFHKANEKIKEDYNQSMKIYRETGKIPVGYERNPDDPKSLRPIPGGPKDVNKYGEDTVKDIAIRYLDGDHSVIAGFHPALREAVQAMVSKIARDRGMSNAEITTNLGDFKQLTSASTQLGRREAITGVTSQAAYDIADQALEASKKIPRSKFLPIGELENKSDLIFNNPEYSNFQAANNAFINAYSKAINPSGVGTDRDKAHAREVLNTAKNDEAYSAAVRRLKNEIDVERQSPGKVTKMINEEYQKRHNSKKNQPSKESLSFVGKTPDGKNVWQDSSGKKFVE